ncbi:MAG: hypothetical protein R2942_19950 [Ignavibacteria bacterium]
MKKTNFLLVIAATCFMFLAFSQMKDEPGNSHQNYGFNNGNNLQVITSSQLNANNINSWYRTNGSFNRIRKQVIQALNGQKEQQNMRDMLQVSGWVAYRK